MNLRSQYIVVTPDGDIIGATGWNLAAAWQHADACDGAVAIAGPVSGVTPVGRDGWPLDEPVVPARSGTVDPVLGDKVRHHDLNLVDAAGASPNARLVSPVSAAGSPASGAPGLVATSADGGTGGAPGAPADCVPVPAPNPNNPKEGE